MTTLNTLSIVTRDFISARSSLWNDVQEAMELPEFEDIELDDGDTMVQYFPVPDGWKEAEAELSSVFGMDVSVMHNNHDWYAMIEDFIQGNMDEEYFEECAIDWLRDCQ